MNGQCIRFLPEQADTQTVAKKRRGEDPVARLQERARWSGFTNEWSSTVAPGTAPRWFRRIIIAAFVVMAVVGLVVGLIGLLTGDDSAQPFPSCPTVPPTGVTVARCLEFPFSTGP
jgi:hypothetical protein